MGPGSDVWGAALTLPFAVFANAGKLKTAVKKKKTSGSLKAVGLFPLVN